MHGKSLQQCLTLCDPIDGSPPGPSVPSILQARILEWVAISFSNACVHAKSLQQCLSLCDVMDSKQSTRLLSSQDSLGKNTGLGCHFILYTHTHIYIHMRLQRIMIRQSTRDFKTKYMFIITFYRRSGMKILLQEKKV